MIEMYIIMYTFLMLILMFWFSIPFKTLWGIKRGLTNIFKKWSRIRLK